VADVVFIAIVVAFFALCVGYVRVCDRIIGPDPRVELSADRVDDELADLEMSEA
jgi:hypothetical protein